MVKKYILEFIVFICGAIVMIYELVGSRLIAPYAGTSIYVWTSLIGVILGSLSLGYYLGGKLADRKAEWHFFSTIIFSAAILIGSTVFLKNIILDFVQLLNVRSNIRPSSLLIPVCPQVALVMISPYSVKLKMKTWNARATVGNLMPSRPSAVSRNFRGGLLYHSYFGTTDPAVYDNQLNSHVGDSILKMFLKRDMWLLHAFHALPSSGVYFRERKGVSLDTPYNKVWIEYGHDERSKKAIITLRTDPFANQSAMFLDSDELVFTYAKYFRLVRHFHPHIKKALMIGGCGYSYPKYFIDKFPESTMDVVEIDPGMTEIARKYFRLQENDRLRIFHEDARTFLNKNKNKYDVIYGDAFNPSFRSPTMLATREATVRCTMPSMTMGCNTEIFFRISGKRRNLEGRNCQYWEYFRRVLSSRRQQNSHDSQNVILAPQDDKTQSFTSRTKAR